MSAPHPHPSLLEARPHIFRSGRGRARGLVKHIGENARSGVLARPASHGADCDLATYLTFGHPAGPSACVHVLIHFFIHSLI